MENNQSSNKQRSEIQISVDETVAEMKRKIEELTKDQESKIYSNSKFDTLNKLSKQAVDAFNDGIKSLENLRNKYSDEKVIEEARSNLLRHSSEVFNQLNDAYAQFDAKKTFENIKSKSNDVFDRVSDDKNVQNLKKASKDIITKIVDNEKVIQVKDKINDNKKINQVKDKLNESKPMIEEKVEIAKGKSFELLEVTLDKFNTIVKKNNSKVIDDVDEEVNSESGV